MKRFVMYWAIAGVLVPVMILLVPPQVRLHPFIILLLWPSGFGTMALGNTDLATTILLISFLIVVNVVIYSAVGMVFWWARRFL
jgi:hypothetical protein